MCRRRFFKSYFYIDYNGVKYQNGETVPVSPFPAAGSSVTITLVAARPWQITNNSWLSISSIQDKSGTYTITLTASANESYSSRSGSFTASTLDERNRIVVSFSQEPQTVEPYLLIENESEHTDARSDASGGSLSYTIQFAGIEESSLAISGYGGNISNAYIGVDKESMSVTLEANTGLTPVTSDLYIIATTVYGGSISAHLIITQPEPAPEPQIDIFVTNPVTSNAGGKCDLLTISWTGLTVGTYILMSYNPNQLNVTEDVIRVTAVTGSISYVEEPEVLLNTGQARTIRITAEWEEDSDITDYQEWQQYGGYVPTYHVWVEDSTTSAEFHNLSLSSITVDSFAVYIDNNVDFTTMGTVPSQSVSSLYGNLTGNTGTSSYQLAVSWSGDSHNNNTTTISWVETVNGVSTRKEYTLKSMGATTDTYYITGDTELSDFVITMYSEIPDPEISGITYYNPSRIIWGTWGSDELYITIESENVDSFIINWDDTNLDIPSFRIMQGGTKTGGTGPSYIVYPGETVVSTSPNGTLVLFADVSVIVSGASSLTNSGNINITAYNNGQVVDNKSINCDS